MRVDLRGGDAGVAEHLLNLPQVGPAGEHVRGEAVPQGVGADLRRRPGPPRVAVQQFPNPLPPQTPPAIGEQHPRRAAGGALRRQRPASVSRYVVTASAARAPSGTIRSLSPLPRQMQ